MAGGGPAILTYRAYSTSTPVVASGARRSRRRGRSPAAAVQEPGAGRRRLKFERGGLAEEQRIDRSVDCGGEGVWAFARGRGGAAGCLRRSVTRSSAARLRPRLLVLAFPRKHRLRESDDLERRGGGGRVVKLEEKKVYLSDYRGGLVYLLKYETV